MQNYTAITTYITETMLQQIGETYIHFQDGTHSNDWLTTFYLLPASEKSICGCDYIGQHNGAPGWFFPISKGNKMDSRGYIIYQMVKGKLVRHIRDTETCTCTSTDSGWLYRCPVCS